MDVDRYLGRINYDGPRDASLETLRALHSAHLVAVPFENRSSPSSPFTQRRICSRLTRAGRISLSDNKHVVTDEDGRKTETEIDDAELSRLLARDFGISL